MNQSHHFGYLEDNNGDKSSKRLLGSILLSIGMILAITLFIISLVMTVSDSVTALKVVEWMFICGGGLLGIGVLEGMKR